MFRNHCTSRTGKNDAKSRGKQTQLAACKTLAHFMGLGVIECLRARALPIDQK